MVWKLVNANDLDSGTSGFVLLFQGQTARFTWPVEAQISEYCTVISDCVAQCSFFTLLSGFCGMNYPQDNSEEYGRQCQESLEAYDGANTNFMLSAITKTGNIYRC